MALLERTRELEQVDFMPAMPPVENFEALRAEIQAHVRAGFDAIDRGLSRTTSPEQYLNSSKQQGGQ